MSSKVCHMTCLTPSLTSCCFRALLRAVEEGVRVFGRRGGRGGGPQEDDLGLNRVTAGQTAAEVSEVEDGVECRAFGQTLAFNGLNRDLGVEERVGRQGDPKQQSN